MLTSVPIAHRGSHAAERERARRSHQRLGWLRSPRRQQHSAHSAGLCWLPAVLDTTTDVKVCEFSAATDDPPGGCRHSARAGPPLAIFSCACITLVPLMKPAWGPQRAQVTSRRWRDPVIARGLLDPNATARRGKCRVSSLGVLERVGERAHPGGRRQSEQRRAGARSCNFSGRLQVDARSGTIFRCIPDPQAHLPSPLSTRPTIGMLNLVLKISWSVSGSSRRSHHAKPRARSIWADFAVAGP